ncbi:MAG: helix-turn-helix domain-containing protein [Planctomycetota bacterium]
MSEQSIQAVDRALQALRVLAEWGPMSASEVAAQIGVDQSTASRQLRSLMDAGFVCKPSFRSFAVDYGLLCFAGTAISSFPIVNRAASACERVCENPGLGAAVCILHETDLIYLARRDPWKRNSSIQLINHSDCPLHRSSMGLVLAHERGKTFFTNSVSPDIEEDPDLDVSSETLFDRITTELDTGGFFDWGEGTNFTFNIARAFACEGETAAMAIFSKQNDRDARIIRMLQRNVSRISDSKQETL